MNFQFSILNYGVFLGLWLKKIKTFVFRSRKAEENPIDSKFLIHNSKLSFRRSLRLNASGFTLIEMLVVLGVLALLASLAASVSLSKIRQSKEAALKEDLHHLRKALDDFYADKAKYPTKLQDLVDNHYLRSIPVDPLTDSADTWQVVTSQDPTQKDGIVDVHSGSPDKTSDGGNYNEW